MTIKELASRWKHLSRIEKLRALQNNRCFYCGCRCTAEGKHRATLDHLLPRSRGGLSVTANLVLACQECNTDKADLTLEEYRLGIKPQVGNW